MESTFFCCGKGVTTWIAGESVRLRISDGSCRQGTIPEIADVLYLADNDPQAFQYRLYLRPTDIIKLELLAGENWTQRENQIHLSTPGVAMCWSWIESKS